MTATHTEFGHSTIPVLDHGLVQLIDFMGDDLAVVEAAQASFAKASDEYTSKEQGILRFLMREEHGVPFEHLVYKFRVRLPIFLSRQYVKHRTSSWSEHSGRYSGLEPLFYTPKCEDVRTQVGKPGAYSFEPVSPVKAAWVRVTMQEHNAKCFELYESYVKAGVSKEQARFVLPSNLYSTVVWTINARSLMNVIRLRVDSHAQWEAQQYAQAFLDLARTVAPDTWDAFIENGMPKP